MSIGKHIKQLERRADYLALRIAESRRSGRNELSYDIAELAALNWAIPLLLRLKENQISPFFGKP